MTQSKKKILKIQHQLNESLRIINKYSDLLGAYVLDFYVNDHWTLLPESWQRALEPLDPTVLSYLLDYTGGHKSPDTVFPLALLALKSTIGRLSISRLDHDDIKKPTGTELKMHNILTKHVKPKKVHEIVSMSSKCKKLAEESSTNCIVDFGAGLGHLARHLTYGNEQMQTICLEQQVELNKQAAKFDADIEMNIRKRFPDTPSFLQPVHIDVHLSEQTTSTEFIEMLSNSITEPLERFGIIGLHTCGDLASILINQFINCNQARFLNIVGCCYLKLQSGYPISSYMKNAHPNLISYEAREIASHAIEVYVQRLRAGDIGALRVHSFRAALELIMVQINPNLKHSQMRSVKHTPLLSFEEYCQRATQSLDVDLPPEAFHCEMIESKLAKWKHVVIFYTLRLMLAPLVESVILLDRMLSLLERGFHAEIVTLFDANISPRNLTLIATKEL